MHITVILFLLNGMSLANNFSMTYAGSYQSIDLCEKGFKDIDLGLDIIGGLHHKCITVQTNDEETESEQE